MKDSIKPIIGQEAICPDGLGRVIAFNLNMPFNTITVSTYVDDRKCAWDANNVTLVPINEVAYNPPMDLAEDEDEDEYEYDGDLRWTGDGPGGVIHD